MSDQAITHERAQRAEDWDRLELSAAEYRRAAARYRRRRSLRGIAFIIPYFVPFVLFLAIPTVWAVSLSFFSGGIIDDARFVGLLNWRRVVADPELLQATRNTLLFVVLAVGTVFILAMLLASLLNRYRRGSNVYKLALYFPLLAPPVIAAIIWQFLVHFDFGVFNLIRTSLGRDQLNFLGQPLLALLVIVGVEVWRGLGFWVLYFLAGLQGVPQDLLDAARVDGAKRRRRFIRVTLPSMRPILLFAVAFAIIVNTQVFDSVFALTQGGPRGATTTVVWLIYRKLFAFQDTGLAYALSMALLLVILLLTLVTFRVLGGRRRGAR